MSSRLFLVLLILAFVPSSLFAQTAKGRSDKEPPGASGAKKQPAKKVAAGQNPSAQEGKKYFREIFPLQCADGCAWQVKAGDLISALGDTGSLSLVPLGSTNIAIYSSNSDTGADAAQLAALKKNINAILSAQPVSIEIHVPKVSDGSDVLNRVKGLDYAGITVNSTVSGSIRITKETG
jgi:hypothetical protein